MHRFAWLLALVGLWGCKGKDPGQATQGAEVTARTEQLQKEESEVVGRREEDTCGAGVTTIVQAPPLPKGSKYGKQDVEPVLQHARRKMGEKGILGSDLPALAANLEKEATSAMGEGDYGKAKFAADQLY